MTYRLAAGFLAVMFLLPAHFSFASDHLEAPAVRTRGDLDINDLYIF